MRPIEGMDEKATFARLLIEDWEAGGDREAVFRRVFERYRGSVGVFFANRGYPSEDCRDLTQETFLRVFRGMKRFRGESSFETWLFRIARNVWLNERRGRYAGKREGEEVVLDEGRATIPVPGAQSSSGWSTSPLDDVLVAERYRLFLDALQRLPQDLQQVVMQRLEGYRYRDIAAVLRLPLGTVKSRLNSAKKKLERLLGGKYGPVEL